MHGRDLELKAVDERFQTALDAASEKTPAFTVKNGVSQKAEGAGPRFHYVSLTRLTTSGSSSSVTRKFEVGGISWMDHEFFTHQLESSQTGWDC